MATTIRRAEPEDASSLTRVAHAAKRHWGYPEHWMNAWSDVLTITPEFISTNDVYVALDQAGVAGFYALMNQGDRVSLEHLWVEPQFMGAGVGRILFSHAIETAASRGAKVVEIESDPNAEGFYLRMGARRVGESVSMIDGRRRALPVLVFYVD